MKELGDRELNVLILFPIVWIVEMAAGAFEVSSEDDPLPNPDSA